MSETPLFGPDDRAVDIETLLRELDASDSEFVAPPADIWTGIETALADDNDRSVVQLDQRRRSTFGTRFLAAAAAIAVLAAGAVVLSSIRGGDDTTVATATLVHEADFDPLGADATATARLVERDGSYEIELDDAALPSDLGEPADLELWLIETDDAGNITDIASVALIDGPGTFPVPSTIDVASHRIVDISIEPRDDDASHSSRSILRGSLQA